ncbi:putative response to unfolded-protein [Rhodotorula diobovata]|uniref:Putative response to unfolded-protein n=1 Tax=Rhodotorula diobovata TaxID=5288 RepID=A0A5C5FQS0_9BASI|nr:putative response to unfolded-protein [Rhodotorula diobovata]
MSASPNTALLSLPPLRPSPHKQPSFARSGSSSAVPKATTTRRARSSSIVSVQEVADTYDDQLDQAAFTNINAEWVNYKGAWLIHVVLIASAILLLETIPGMSQDLTWTIVNLGYLSVSYVIFHYVTGVPFDMTNNSGAFDNLTLWEQIDSGAQYTPAKKWLTSVPIFLFLLSTHYTRYDSHPALFTLNLVALLFLGLAPKLPAFHRLRIKFFDAGDATPDPSAPPTPKDEEFKTR